MAEPSLPSEALASLRSHLSKVKVADSWTNVYKDECAMCFDTPQSEGGLLIDLSSFLGFSESCVKWHHAKTGNAVYLRIRRVPQPPEEVASGVGSSTVVGDGSEERPFKKPTILGIGVEGGFNSSEQPKLTDQLSIVLLPDFIELPYPNMELPELISMSVDSVIKSEGAEKKESVAAWVVDKKVSKAALNLTQLENGVRIPSSGWCCSVPGCGKTENLWFNLTDGTILCGRKMWDGSGGNGHALEHYEKTKHPLCVKLGTITRDLENADVFSYEEDDSVIDPHLAKHLAHFGIDFASLTKTEQTTAEKELDQNLSFDWSRLQEEGKALTPLYGPGFTGLANLGNSCYMASVLQVLFSTPHFDTAFFKGISLEEAYSQAPHDLIVDFPTQLVKLAHGLLSGKYSQPPKNVEGEEPGSKPVEQQGIRPFMLKSILGKNHAEFASARQQDAFELYQYVLELLSKLPPTNIHHTSDLSQGADKVMTEASNGSNLDPRTCFGFLIEDRIQCGSSGKVKYATRPDNALSLAIPLEASTNKDEVAAYQARKKEAESRGEKLVDGDVVRPRVPLSACIEVLSATEAIPDFYSPATNTRTTAHKTTRLASFPDLLVLHMRKYVVEPGSWAPKKLDVFLDVPDKLDLTHLRATGLQPGEELLPEDEPPQSLAAESAATGATAASPAVPVQADEVIVSALEALGFPRGRCEKAAVMTGNASMDEAATWLLNHMEDADIDDPLQPAGGSATSASATPAVEVDSSSVAMLLDFGFTSRAARNALRATGGNMEAAADWILMHPDEAEADEAVLAPHVPSGTGPSGGIEAPAGGGTASSSEQIKEPAEKFPDGPGTYELFAFVSHMGANTQCGHYVAHIKKADGQWALFNDAKVALSEDPPKDMGYLYFYKRS